MDDTEDITEQEKGAGDIGQDQINRGAGNQFTNGKGKRDGAPHETQVKQVQPEQGSDWLLNIYHFIGIRRAGAM